MATECFQTVEGPVPQVISLVSGKVHLTHKVEFISSYKKFRFHTRVARSRGSTVQVPVRTTLPPVIVILVIGRESVNHVTLHHFLQPEVQVRNVLLFLSRSQQRSCSWQLLGTIFAFF